MKKIIFLSFAAFVISTLSAKDLKLVNDSLLNTIDWGKTQQTSIDVDWSNYPDNLPKNYYCFDESPMGNECDISEIPDEYRADAFAYLVKKKPYLLYFLDSNGNAKIASTPKDYARVLLEYYESKNYSLSEYEKETKTTSEESLKVEEGTSEQIAFCEQLSKKLLNTGEGSPSGNDFSLCLSEKLWDDLYWINYLKGA